MNLLRHQKTKRLQRVSLLAAAAVCLAAAGVGCIGGDPAADGDDTAMSAQDTANGGTSQPADAASDSALDGGYMMSDNGSYVDTPIFVKA